jgi:hypothetical protein
VGANLADPGAARSADHNHLDLTMNVYGHVQLDGLRTALDGLDDLLR